jgi:hypothetical protein
LLPFLVGPCTEGMRQERPFLRQAANASGRPEAQHSSQAIERRESTADLADRGLGRLSWADSCPPGHAVYNACPRTCDVHGRDLERQLYVDSGLLQHDDWLSGADSDLSPRL